MLLSVRSRTRLEKADELLVVHLAVAVEVGQVDQLRDVLVVDALVERVQRAMQLILAQPAARVLVRAAERHLRDRVVLLELGREQRPRVTHLGLDLVAVEQRRDVVLGPRLRAAGRRLARRYGRQQRAEQGLDLDARALAARRGGGGRQPHARQLRRQRRLLGVDRAVLLDDARHDLRQLRVLLLVLDALARLARQVGRHHREEVQVARPALNGFVRRGRGGRARNRLCLKSRFPRNFECGKAVPTYPALLEGTLDGDA